MIVKINKYDRRFRWSQAKIITHNSFESSSDKEEDQIIEEGENNEEVTNSTPINWTLICKKVRKSKPSKLTGKIRKADIKYKDELDHFKTPNPYQVLEDI